MSDKSDTPAPIEGAPIKGDDAPAARLFASIVPPPPVAPFVFFDLATVYGFNDGVVAVTVEAVRHTVGPDGNSKAHDCVVVGHLRMSLSACQSLRRALESAEIMAAASIRNTGTAH